MNFKSVLNPIKDCLCPYRTCAIIGKLKNKNVIMEVFIHDSNLGKKEGNEGLLKVTVPAEKVDKALDQAFKK